MSSNDGPSQPTTSSSRLPVAKLTAIARLKSFGEHLVPKKKIVSLQPTFPPPSWNIEDFNPASTNWMIPPPEAPPPIATGVATSGVGNDETNAVGNIEPITFAKRLRSLIELLPIPGGLTPTTSLSTTPPSAESSAAQAASVTPLIPPEMDPNLIKILSSEEVMNGDSTGKGQGRPGIWGLLAGLRKNDNPLPDGSVSPIEEQESGIMMYSPIVPQSDSVVELARTETIQSTETSTGSPSKSNISLPPTGPAEVHVWVPSTTELSILTTWWGYRLYLPPPVMAKLGATSVKAAVRAAMITSALNWLIDKIPMALVPAQFLPAIKMLKILAPFASYVGVFVAWSWDRIQTLDEGNGVVLTATWLSPVALIPMAWDAGDIYRPHLPPEVQDAIGEPEHNDDGKKKKTKGEKEKAEGQGKHEADAKPTKKSRFVWL